jgi:hypothetical protein
MQDGRSLHASELGCLRPGWQNLELIAGCIKGEKLVAVLAIGFDRDESELSHRITSVSYAPDLGRSSIFGARNSGVKVNRKGIIQIEFALHAS